MGDTGLKERSLPAIIKDQSKRKDSPVIRQYGKLFLFFGVILPVAAVLFETNTHYCAQHYFDPFPSPAHVVLFLLIPFSNFLAWLSCRRDLSAHYGFMALASGMAMGIGVLYGLMFLPLTPMSCIAIAAFGFGLLGLAPLLSIPCSWLSGKNVCKLASKKKTYFDAHLVEHIGHLIILVMVVAVEAPSTLTRIHLAMAVEPDTAQQGINWLRKYGSEEVMLRACYERSGRATDILGSLYESHHSIGINEARDAFYRVTGKPFNSVAIPASARATIQRAGLVDDPHGLNAGVVDEFDLDGDIAGETVSGVARGVVVTDSNITGTIDPDALVGQLTWSFRLTNTFKYDREARAKILLPPGAVVTKATLTVDGVEHDAKIMVRSVARAIYQDAVAQRKDPLLVSTCGTDEILVQCFPVHPNSFMTVKLTIATPLELLASTGNGNLVLPTFSEKNFQLQRQTQVNIEAPTELHSNIKDLMFRVQPDKTTSPGMIVNVIEPKPKDPNYFADQFVSVSTERNADCLTVSCRDNFRRGHWLISKNIETEHFRRPNRLIVLVDGSVGVLRWRQDILNGLRQIPSGLPVKVVFMRDRENILAETQTGSVQYNAALNEIEKLDFLGGQDDSVSLNNALTETLAREQSVNMMHREARVGSNAVLWIHGSQPMTPKRTILSTIHAWQQPLLYDLQVAPGPNEILAGVEPCAELVRVNRTGSPTNDLLWLWQAWAPEKAHKPVYSEAPVKVSTIPVAPGATPDLLIRPTSAARAIDVGESARPGPEAKQPTVTQAPEYMAQLYGYNRLITAFHQSGMSPDSEAYALASRYHLVSPVSSAVVTDEIPKLQVDIVAPHVMPGDNVFPSNLLSDAFTNVTSQLNRLNESPRTQVTDVEFFQANDKDIGANGGRGTEGYPEVVMGKLRQSASTAGSGQVAVAPLKEEADAPKQLIQGYEPPLDRPTIGEKKAMTFRGAVGNTRGPISGTEGANKGGIPLGGAASSSVDEFQTRSGASKTDDNIAYPAQEAIRGKASVPMATNGTIMMAPAAAPAPSSSVRREKVRWYNAPHETETVEIAPSKPDLGILNQEGDGQDDGAHEQTAPGYRSHGHLGFGWPFQEQHTRFYQSTSPMLGMAQSTSILDGRSVLVVFWTLIAFIVSMIVGTKHASRRRQGKFCTEYAVQGIVMIIAIPTVVFLMGTLIIRFLPF